MSQGKYFVIIDIFIIILSFSAHTKLAVDFLKV